MKPTHDDIIEAKKVYVPLSFERYKGQLTPHSTGRRFCYAHGDLGFSLKLIQIAAEA